MLEYIFITAALIGGLIGAIIDLKERWMPDYVNYFLISLGLGGNAILSIVNISIWPFVYSLMGVGIFFGVASALYYSGAWGGGDAKYLIALGALFPITPSIIQSIAPWPFLITIFMNILFVSSIYGVLFWLIIAIKNKKITTKIYKTIPINKLMEGDHVVESEKYNYKEKRTGANKKDVEEIKKLGLSHIKVRDGIPNIPALVIALIVTLLYGDIMFNLIMGLI